MWKDVPKIFRSFEMLGESLSAIEKIIRIYQKHGNSIRSFWKNKEILLTLYKTCMNIDVLEFPNQVRFAYLSPNRECPSQQKSQKSIVAILESLVRHIKIVYMRWQCKIAFFYVHLGYGPRCHGDYSRKGPYSGHVGNWAKVSL